MVPGERIELPTNGLQNRCSTAELTRQYLVISITYGVLVSGFGIRLASGFAEHFENE
jgi:hypothetical protein